MTGGISYNGHNSLETIERKIAAQSSFNSEVVDKLKQSYRSEDKNGKKLNVGEFVTKGDFAKYIAPDMTQEKRERLYSQLAGSDGYLQGRDIDAAYAYAHFKVDGKGTGDGVGQVCYHACPQDKITKQALKNPDSSLAGDCSEILAKGLPEKPASAYVAFETEIRDLAKQYGGADEKLQKLVLHSHGGNGKVYYEKKDGTSLELDAGKVAEIAAKYIEKNGELIMKGCFIAPDEEKIITAHDGSKAKLDPVEGKKTQSTFAAIADKYDINIKFTTNDFGYSGGDPLNVNDYAMVDLSIAVPSGHIGKDNHKIESRPERQEEIIDRKVQKFIQKTEQERLQAEKEAEEKELKEKYLKPEERKELEDIWKNKPQNASMEELMKVIDKNDEIMGRAKARRDNWTDGLMWNMGF